MEESTDKDILNCVILDLMLCSPANLKSIRQALVITYRFKDRYSEKPKKNQNI